jgi:hypothetical protein
VKDDEARKGGEGGLAGHENAEKPRRNMGQGNHIECIGYGAGEERHTKTQQQNMGIDQSGQRRAGAEGQGQ